jgi:hypothetical protein
MTGTPGISNWALGRTGSLNPKMAIGLKSSTLELLKRCNRAFPQFYEKNNVISG